MPKLNSKNFERTFFIILLIISLIGTATVYLFKFNGPPIRSDGLGYYAYLPSIFVKGDITMNKFVEDFSSHYDQKKPDQFNGINKYENTGNYLDKYPIGVAIMMSPFFLMGHVTSLIVHNFVPSIEADGYFSPFYHIFVSLGGTFYMLLGLFILKRILDKYFKPKVVYLTIFLLTFGTNIFHYATYDAVFSHAYSFFLFASFLYLTIKWYENVGNAHGNSPYSLLLGLVSGLIIVVRPTNAIFLLIFILYGINLEAISKHLTARVKLFLKQWKHILIIVATCSLLLVPQLLYWKYITGKFIVFSYTGEGFDFTHPQITNVLFSVEKGLFFWAPILIFAIAGIYLVSKNKKLKAYFLPLISYILLATYIISAWGDWTYGGSFGHRAFIESFVILAIPMAAFYSWLFEQKNKFVKISILILSSILCFLTIYLMIQYWRGLIPIDGATINDYINALLNK